MNPHSDRPVELENRTGQYLPGRRQWLKDSAVLSCGIVGCLADNFGSCSNLAQAQPALTRSPAASSTSSGRGLPANWRQLRKFDIHNHVFAAVHEPGADWQAVTRLVETAERLGIERVCCSRPITGGKMAGIAEVREANNSVLAAMKRYPDRILGFAFIQPGNGADAIDEIQRCHDAGMVGVKLYNQYRYSDPVVYPIAEKCIQLEIPLLGHSAHLTDAKSLAAQPKTSDATDFCMLSWRFPQLKLILGHINGGGDWEWEIKALRDCKNVYVDTSGSVLEHDTIEMCVRELGHERLLFATDQTMEGGVGKILAADVTDEERHAIFYANAARLLNSPGSNPQ